MDANSHAAHLREGIERLTPDGARLVLEFIEAGKVKYPQDITLALLLRAGEKMEPEKPAPPPEPAKEQEIQEDLKC